MSADSVMKVVGTLDDEVVVVQAWAPDAPDELDATLRLTAAGDGERPPGVDVVGGVLGGEADAAELLGELVDSVGMDPMAASRRHMHHRAAKRYLEGSDRSKIGGSSRVPSSHAV
jgi:hypothetical protein